MQTDSSHPIAVPSCAPAADPLPAVNEQSCGAGREAGIPSDFQQTAPADHYLDEENKGDHSAGGSAPPPELTTTEVGAELGRESPQPEARKDREFLKPTDVLSLRPAEWEGQAAPPWSSQPPRAEPRGVNFNSRSQQPRQGFTFGSGNGPGNWTPPNFAGGFGSTAASSFPNIERTQHFPSQVWPHPSPASGPEHYRPPRAVPGAFLPRAYSEGHVLPPTALYGPPERMCNARGTLYSGSSFPVYGQALFPPDFRAVETAAADEGGQIEIALPGARPSSRYQRLLHEHYHRQRSQLYGMPNINALASPFGRIPPNVIRGGTAMPVPAQAAAPGARGDYVPPMTWLREGVAAPGVGFLNTQLATISSPAPALEARHSAAAAALETPDDGDDEAADKAGGLGDNAYNDIGLVVTRTKELEKILRDLFGASGEAAA